MIVVQFDTILFNMPFGAMSVIAILGGAYATNKVKLRFAVIVWVAFLNLRLSKPQLLALTYRCY